MKTFVTLIIITFSAIIFSQPSIDGAVLIKDNLYIKINEEVIMIELQDEQEIYHFATEGKEYSLKHYREDCNWSADSVFSCENFVEFNNTIINVQKL